jgi:hypothetical protein
LVPATHHRERVGVVKIRSAKRFCHRDLACVDQIGVDLRTGGGPAHAEHAVLGVQYHPRLRPQMICDEGRLADVDIRACGDVARDCGGQFVLTECLPR